jgi:hypothetical protein
MSNLASLKINYFNPTPASGVSLFAYYVKIITQQHLLFNYLCAF